MSNFYPHGKPGWCAYTQKFVDDGFVEEHRERAIINTKYPGLDEPNQSLAIGHALTNLQILINSARAAETAFLKDTGIDITEKASANDIFRYMNDILNSKQTFERGIKYMKQLSKVGKDGKKEQTYRDVTRYFGSYLEAAVRKEMKGIKANQLVKMTSQEIENLINNIISEALISSYEKVRDFIGKDGKIRGKFGNKTAARENEEEIQAITDMIEVKNTNAFGQLGHLFNLDENTLLAWRKKEINFKQRKGNKYNNAQVDSNYGGNALEVVSSMVAAELGNINIQTSGGDLRIVGKHTGQDNQMKADALLFVGRGKINPDDYIEYIDNQTFNNHVRMQNVDALERYLNNLEKNISHVIAISDKNYSIKADFEGITAQEKMKLQDVGLLLSQFGVGQVAELINYLANCGNEMIHEDVDGRVRTVLQTYIGYFLFDHLQIDTGAASNGPNVVNLINVSGMYIPLSVYLEGIYKSLEQAFLTPAKFVSVSISLGGDTTAPSNWTAEIWGNFRESHEIKTFIEYKILKGIADFISNL